MTTSERISEVYFSTIDGKEIGRLESIDECTLTVDPSPEDDIKKRYFSSKDMTATMSIDIAADSVTQIEKFIICGGNKGRYNGYRLKKDGYLSPENAWVEESHD